MIERKRFIQVLICLGLITLFAIPTLSSTQIHAISIFTGDVPTDFADSPGIIIVDNPKADNSTSSETPAISGDPDVFMPSPPYARNDISGWDVNAIYMEYDPELDMMFVGIDCFTVCGDADNDGSPDRAGAVMRRNGGSDIAKFGQFESVALLIDTDNDYRTLSVGDFEVAVGISQSDSLTSFGVYQFTGAVRAPYIGFGQRLPNAVTMYSLPNPSTPDFEFGIANFSQLPGFDFKPGDEFSFRTMLYAGSQRDAEIGEEFVPGRGSAASVIIEKSSRRSSTTGSSTGASSQASPTPTTYRPYATATPYPTAAPLSSEPPQRLRVPAIGVDTVVKPMGWGRVQKDDGTFATDWNVVDNAAGWHRNSSLPNRVGNVVLSGHNTIGGSVFRNLYKLEEGDEIILWHDNQSHQYEINNVIIVPEEYATRAQRIENAQYMKDFGDERITLISCWPPGSASHRVIVIGEPIQ